MKKNGKSQFSLATHDVEVPGYGTIRIQDLSIRKFREITEIKDKQKRTLAMLAASVLDEEGDPVDDIDVIETYPFIVMSVLVSHIEDNNIFQLGGTENPESPLTNQNEPSSSD